MSRIFYFGCRYGPGHYLHDENMSQIRPSEIPNFPFDLADLDGAMLRNMAKRDHYDGRVFAIVHEAWLGFCWWDRSIDSRPGSNSGIYMPNENYISIAEPFELGLLKFPTVYARQQFPLRLDLEAWPAHYAKRR